MSNYAPQPTKEYEYDSPDSPFEAQPQTERKKSGCFKGCLIIAIVGVIGLIVCCVGFGIYYVNSFYEDPAEVTRIARDIIDSPLVDEVDGTSIGSNASIMRFAMKGDNEGNLFLVLESFLVADDNRVTDMRKAIYDSLAKNEQLYDAEEVKVIEDGKETIEIFGNDVTLSFDEVEGLRTDERFWEITGVIPKDKDRIAVYFRLRTDQFDKQEIIDQLESSQ